jgi:Fe-S-cluster-containing dehydrogenase component
LEVAGNIQCVITDCFIACPYSIRQLGESAKHTHLKHR